jgi:hypothetical protein
MATSQFVTRKEIARANELSAQTIRRKERSIGLDRIRDRACDRPVRYDGAAAAELLRSKGLRAP